MIINFCNYNYFSDDFWVKHGNLQAIISVIGHIIKRYHIGETLEKHASDIVQNFIRTKLPGIITTKFTPSDWSDGTRLSMLVNSIQPGLIPDADSLNPEDALRNTRTALELADEQLGIPRVINNIIDNNYNHRI